MTKSATAVPRRLDGAVRTVKMLGSGWSCEILPMTEKRARSYL